MATSKLFTLKGARLQVEFARVQDRFAHVVSAIDASSRVTPLAESLEGTAEQSWPPSPPLQESRSEIDTQSRQVLLLLGMAGKAHWSMSVEIDASSNAIVFDVACRFQTAPEWLGSVYGLLDLENSGYELKTFNDPSAPPCGVKLIEGEGRVAPVWENGGNMPRTVRWKYQFRLISG